MSEGDAHETFRIAARRLHWIAIGLLGSLLVIVLIMYWLSHSLVTGIPDPGVDIVPPEPRLQPHPQRDLAALRRRERAALNADGWVDREAGIATIPIERAMTLLAAEATDASARDSATGRHAAGSSDDATAAHTNSTDPAIDRAPRDDGGTAALRRRPSPSPTQEPAQ